MTIELYGYVDVLHIFQLPDQFILMEHRLT